MKKEYTNEDVCGFLARESQHDEALLKEFGMGIMSRSSDTDFWDSLSEHLDCFRVCDECGKPMIERPCEMIMNETEIKIPAGGMYQEWMSLIDLVDEDTAKKLESLANNGDQCVFELLGSENVGSREGKIVLTKCKCKGKDSEYNCGFTIKEYHSKKKQREDGSWEQERIRLKSINPQYPTIEITQADAENNCAVEVFKTVL